MTELLAKTKKGLISLWEGIREVTGDNAYEKYVKHVERLHANDPGCPVPTREEFYKQRMEKKFSDPDNPSRCC